MIWIYLDKVSEKLVGWWINGEMWCPTSLQMRQLGLACCGLSWFMIVSTGETKHTRTFCSISWEHHMYDYWWGAMLVCYSSFPRCILVGCSDFYLFRHNMTQLSTEMRPLLSLCRLRCRITFQHNYYYLMPCAVPFQQESRISQHLPTTPTCCWHPPCAWTAGCFQPLMTADFGSKQPSADKCVNPQNWRRHFTGNLNHFWGSVHHAFSRRFSRQFVDLISLTADTHCYKWPRMTQDRNTPGPVI